MAQQLKTPNLNKALPLIGNETLNALQKQLSSNELGASQLYKNIKYKVKNLFLSIVVPGYGVFVDEGTKPHMPPVSSIQKWADDKGLNAWAVAKKIEKFGTKAQPFLFEIDKVFIQAGDKIADAGLLDVVNTTDELFRKTGGKVIKKN